VKLLLAPHTSTIPTHFLPPKYSSTTSPVSPCSDQGIESGTGILFTILFYKSFFSKTDYRRYLPHRTSEHLHVHIRHQHEYIESISYSAECCSSSNNFTANSLNYQFFRILSRKSVRAYVIPCESTVRDLGPKVRTHDESYHSILFLVFTIFNK
jgi:hypothetical protein